MKVSTEEAALMVAAKDLAKKAEAIEAELVAAQAARDRAAPQCRECSVPLLTRHAMEAAAALGIDIRATLLAELGRDRADDLLLLWSVGFCSRACEVGHQQRKEQAASWEAENVSRFKAALRVKEES